MSSKNVEGIKVVLEASAEPLKKQLREAKKAAESYIQGVNSTVGQSGKEISGVTEQVRSLADSIKDYVKKAQLDAGIRQYSESYRQAMKDVQAAEAEMKKARIRAADFPEADKHQLSEPYKQLEKSMESTRKELERLAERKEKLEQSGKAFISSEEYDQTVARIRELEQELSGLQDRKEMYASLGFKESDMQSITQAIAETREALEGLSEKRRELESVGDHRIPTEAYEALTDKMAEASQKLQDYTEQKKQMEADGSSQTETKRWKDVQRGIESAASHAQQYREVMAQMESNGTDTESITQGFSSGSYIESAVATARRALQSIGPAVAEVKNQVAEAVQEVPVLGRTVTEASYLAKKGFSLMQAAAARVTAGIKKSGGAVAALIQKFSSGLPSLNLFNKGVGQSGTSLRGALKSVLMYGLGLRSLFALVNKVRSAITDGMNNLATYSSTTNANLSLLSSQLSQLKNSLASAFEPILTVVTPILSQLIDYVLAATNAIAQFFAALTGSSTYTVAKRVATDYASSLSDTADSASDATDAANELKRTLMGFDEVNKLDDSTSSSGSGSGSSGSGTSGSDLFTTETVSNTAAEWADMIKEAWANADFTEVGAAIGEKLKEALDSIDWDPIKETAEKIGKSLATLINGFVEVEGLADSIGSTVAEAINTGVLGVDAFLTNVHWDSVGQFIADGLNAVVRDIDWDKLGTTIGDYFSAGLTVITTAITEFDWDTAGTSLATGINSMISTISDTIDSIDWKTVGSSISEGINSFAAKIDWAKLAQTISSGITGALDSLSSAISNVDWEALGEDVRTFLTNIDWAGIAQSAFTLLGTAFGGLAAFIGGLIGDGFTNIGDYFNDEIEDCGGDIVAGIFKGITDAILNIGTWIKENILDPFIEGFCEAFGIASPSTVMAEQGGFIISGLLQGIVDGLGNIATWVVDNIVTPILDALANAWETAGAAVEVGVGLVKQGWETVTGWLGSAANTVIEAAVSLAKKVGAWADEAWSVLQNAGQTVTSTVKAAVEKAATWVSDAWTAATATAGSVTRTVKGAVEKAATWVSDAWTAATATAGSVTRTVKGAVEKANTWVSDAWTAATKTAGSVTRTVQAAVEKAKGWSDTAWTAATKAAGSITRTVKALAEKAKGWSDTAWSAATKAAGSITRTVKALAEKAKGWSDTAWSAATKAKGSITRTVKALAKKASGWSDTAWSAAKTTAGTIKKTLQISVSWIGDKLSEAWKLITGKASGGTFTVSGGWKNIPQYASGGSPHGTMFVAGEAGPEIVGNVNGRTEVLNKSQIASAIYQATYAAMMAAMQSSGGNGGSNITITLQGDAKGLFRIVKAEATKYTESHGVPAFPT